MLSELVAHLHTYTAESRSLELNRRLSLPLTGSLGRGSPPHHSSTFAQHYWESIALWSTLFPQHSLTTFIEPDSKMESGAGALT